MSKCTFCNKEITGIIYYICIEFDVYKEGEQYCSSECAVNALEKAEKDE